MYEWHIWRTYVLNKTKFDYEIEEFKKAFWDKKDKKIAIYGTGRMTATLLSQIEGFQIVGLLDRDENLIGTERYGVDIISKEKAENIADLVIINTAETYWNTIYMRIKTWKLPIYFRNGKLASENENQNSLIDEYWSTSYSELKQKISEYEIVSFDIFDTLLMRKVFLPSDVFILIEKKIQFILGIHINFAELRRQAAAVLNNPTLDEIYLKLQELTGLDDILVNKIKRCEWETDLQLIAFRKDMIELCQETMKLKEVYFVSDMYYPARLLKEILHTNGLEVDENHIIVSCDHKMNKEDGTLWAYYNKKVLHNKKGLHVGDNKKADCVVPQRYGIDTYFVRSAYEMLMHSSLKNVLASVDSLSASITMGLIQTSICNSPFALNRQGGVISFDDETVAGYCLFGNFCYSFLLWLMKNSIEDCLEEIFFFARDGYLLIEQYRYMQELLKDIKLPEAVYLDISRRAIMNASIETPDDIYEVAAFPYSGNSLSAFLQDRFRTKINDPEIESISVMNVQKDDKKLSEVLQKYIDKIYDNTQIERRNYCKYLSTLNIKSEIGIVDSWLYGNTQYYFGKLIKKRMHGYYFCACLDKDNKCFQNQDMKACFQKNDDITGKDSAILKNSIFVEAFFTAPNGMLICMDSEGRGVYEEEMTNQKKFGIRRKMQSGILQFIRDILFIQKWIPFEQLYPDTIFAEQLFGCFMNNGFVPSEEMKQSFFYDNGILNHNEVPIWE